MTIADFNTLKQEEDMAVTIESIERKIYETVMLFKGHYKRHFGDDAEEILRLEQLEKNLKVTIETYKKQEIFFSRYQAEPAVSPSEIKKKILTDFKAIIEELGGCAIQLNNLLGGAKKEESIDKAYDALIKHFNAYITKEKEMVSLIKAQEMAESQLNQG